MLNVVSSGLFKNNWTLLCVGTLGGIGSESEGSARWPSRFLLPSLVPLWPGLHHYGK